MFLHLLFSSLFRSSFSSLSSLFFFICSFVRTLNLKPPISIIILNTRMNAKFFKQKIWLSAFWELFSSDCFWLLELFPLGLFIFFKFHYEDGTVRINWPNNLPFSCYSIKTWSKIIQFDLLSGTLGLIWEVIFVLSISLPIIFESKTK